ncbi:hypothetical protein BSNK01_08250 [Bacillaceae bacterium]
MYGAYRRADHERALEMHRFLVRLAIYQCSMPFFFAIKEALHQLGLPYRTGVRPPCGKIDETLIENVRKLLQENALLHFCNGFRHRHNDVNEANGNETVEEICRQWQHH